MSKTDYYTTAVSLGDLKNGMLYFDNLIPVLLTADLVQHSRGDMSTLFTDMNSKLLREILPKELTANKEFTVELGELNWSAHNLLLKMLQKQFKLPDQLEGYTKSQYDQIEKNFANEYLSFIDKFNLQSQPLISYGNSTFASLPDDNNLEQPGILTLSKLNLIDPSNASWEQLVEFKKDPDAKAKLRKLRLFAYENYEGKSKNYIEDDISTKIYDYEKTAKKFGFDMLQATINNVVNSKLFTGMATGSLIATVFAQPSMSIFAVSTGIAIEIGQFGLEFKKQKYELQSLLRDNPASFIIYSKENLEDDPSK